MTIFEAIIIGIIQGLTEFLPVSSSGHIELSKALLGVQLENNLEFSIAVHVATVLSTLLVFRKEIIDLFSGFFSLKLNSQTHYVFKLIISAVPVGIIGVLFKDQIETLFEGNLLVVGSMLLVTAILLALTRIVKPKNTKPVGYFDSVVIGLAQAVAVMPGLSRSGATISTGLLLGKDRDEVARFSFLMVIIPVLGAAFLDIIKGDISNTITAPVVAGFVAAFVSGFLACSFMLRIVRKGNLYWFALYCALVGIVALFLA
ncbi:MAG: undecaprenyl-diphosphate phosphatase [Tenuifilum sp.]|uniref:undecaprenyl-diphosphate phosphatase n=1 Tax=Tenuifilum sp. TaxID=2760880 RepID=UPI002C867F53|nr:undecaprenyl-diphosphate phosphatase [Tenuifilum sp.]HOK85561.1 undecaprenyl-diphosphate phosphatase [Tenuifilum sp.]HON70472.1 undecaprenyl-diphosphate phosphatase [Tenuifilum sp.]HOU75021.1 undecaprenyl-diphosphate phosphatase [Tenuifilum sp.]HPP89963.1 undecaprenyl-diphosphate phosphatase [Tenuifilum sp.]